MYIKDRTIRREVSKRMRKLSRKYNLEKANLISTISEVDIYIKIIGDIKRQDMTMVRKRDTDRLTIAYLLILCLHFFSLSVYHNEDNDPLPRTWCGSGENPNPNLVWRNLLMQCTNTAFACVRLLEDGLEHPSRSLLRSFYEICMIAIVVAAEEDNMRLYVSMRNEAEAYAIWRREFSPRPLRDKIKAVHEKIADTGFAQMLDSWIQKEYSFYSSSAHSMYLPTMILASMRPSSRARIRYDAIFGGPSVGISECLYKIIFWILLTIGCCVHILIRIHKKVPHNKEWVQFLFLYESVSPVAWEWVTKMR